MSWQDLLKTASTQQTLKRALGIANDGQNYIYELGAGGTDPVQPLTQHCDCSGFVAWCIGTPRELPPGSNKWLNTDCIYAGGKPVKAGLFTKVPIASAAAGDLMVYPGGNGDYGHVGIVTETGTGGPTKVVHCSHGNYRTYNNAVKVTDPAVFLGNPKTHAVQINYAAFQSFTNVRAKVAHPRDGVDISPLQSHIPDNVYTELGQLLTPFSINNTLRIAHFMSQCSYESAAFTAVSENLNYGAPGLSATFPKYFDPPTDGMPDPADYARQPQKIANYVYANRMGNGDTGSGDGWNYRGRGYIQLTGKDNYTAFSNFEQVPDIITNPDLVATTYPLTSAAYFFQTNNLFAICDEGATDEVVEELTQKINGGQNGIDQRKALFYQYYGWLTPPGTNGRRRRRSS